jgi:Flp pilus assembly pilin Flp
MTRVLRPSPLLTSFCRGSKMMGVLSRLSGDDGQDIAEYAVMLAVILAVVVGTIKLIGSNANNVFSSVASSIQ